MGCRTSKGSVLPSHRNLDPAPPTPNPGRASFTQRRRPVEPAPAPTPNPSTKVKELPAASSGGSWENGRDIRLSPEFESPIPAGRPAWMMIENTPDMEYGRSGDARGGVAHHNIRSVIRRNNSQISSSAADMEVVEPIGGTRLQLTSESDTAVAHENDSE